MNICFVSHCSADRVLLWWSPPPLFRYLCHGSSRHGATRFKLCFQVSDCLAVISLIRGVFCFAPLLGRLSVCFKLKYDRKAKSVQHNRAFCFGLLNQPFRSKVVTKVSEPSETTMATGSHTPVEKRDDESKRTGNRRSRFIAFHIQHDGAICSTPVTQLVNIYEML